MQFEHEIEQLQEKPTTVVVAKRWTATDMKLWQEDFFNLNPMLKQPEYQPVLCESSTDDYFERLG